MVEKNYLAATIDYAFDSTDRQSKHVTFTVEPGPQFTDRQLVFEGASAIAPDELRSVVESQKLTQAVYTNPSAVTDLLARLYRERGYLDAAIDAPKYEFDRVARRARTVFLVHEGPQYHIHRVSMSGNHAYTTPELVSAIPSVSGDPYLPATAERSLTKIRQMYWSKAYNDVQPTYRLTLDGKKGLANLQFTIQEGRRSIVDSIDVRGTRETTTHLVRGELAIQPGRPLDLSELSESRKELYNTNAFALVDISRDTVGTSGSAPAGGTAGVGGGSARASEMAGPAAVTSALTGLGPAALAGTATQPNEVPVRVHVAVREVQPFQLRYGASYDTEGGLGGILDVINHNSLGKAREVGLQTRYDSQTHDARLYFSQPTLRYFPRQTIASVYYRQERNPATSTSNAFNLDRTGVSVEQEAKLADDYVWSYGYRFERARNWSPDVLDVAPSYTRVSPLTSTLTRDTRDEALDAVRGSFLSHAFSFSPHWLGADSGYVKYFAQVLPLHPAPAADAQAVHQRDRPPASGLCGRDPAGPGARHQRRRGAAQRAVLRGRQHDAARLRAEHGRPDRHRRRPPRRRRDAGHQQRGAVSAGLAVRRRHVRGRRERLPGRHGLLVREPAGGRGRRPAASHAVVPRYGSTTVCRSAAARASRTAACSSASARPSSPRARLRSYVAQTFRSARTVCPQRLPACCWQA